MARKVHGALRLSFKEECLFAPQYMDAMFSTQTQVLNSDDIADQLLVILREMLNQAQSCSGSVLYGSLYSNQFMHYRVTPRTIHTF